MDKISIDWLIKHSQELLLDGVITGREMKFLRKLIKEWEQEQKED